MGVKKILTDNNTKVNNNKEEFNKLNSNIGNTRCFHNSANKSSPEKEDSLPTKKRRRGQSFRISAAHNQFAEDCIAFWNSFPGVQRHTRPNTQIYKNIKNKIHWFLSGQFNSNVFVKPQFLETHKIPDWFLTKAWTEEEIKKGIERLSKFSQDAYWPTEKDNFRSLDTLLYDNYGQTSWFLAVLYREPVPLRNRFAKDEYSHITRLFRAKLGRQLDNDAEIKLIYNMKDLAEDYKSLCGRDRFGRLQARFPVLENFVSDYIEWVDSQHWVRGWNVGLASINSGVYIKYRDTIYEDFDFNGRVG